VEYKRSRLAASGDLVEVVETYYYQAADVEALREIAKRLAVPGAWHASEHFFVERFADQPDRSSMCVIGWTVAQVSGLSAEALPKHVVHELLWSRIRIEALLALIQETNKMPRRKQLMGIWPRLIQWNKESTQEEVVAGLIKAADYLATQLELVPTPT
jgi:hypothetical protein